jgi:hypothetical protein
MAMCFILDTTAIHSGGDAGNVKDYLLGMVVDGCPLNVFVIILLTQSWQRNPIELVFHILACRICSFRYRMAGPCDNAVLCQATKALNAKPF